MCNKITDYIKQDLFTHAFRLSNLKFGLDILQRCIEDSGYIDSNSELCSLAAIINEYFINTKLAFDKIENDLDLD